MTTTRCNSVAPRTAQCADSHSDRRRSPVRRADRWLGDRRDGLRLARGRLVAYARRLCPRRAGGARHGTGDWSRVHLVEPVCRPVVSLSRPSYPDVTMALAAHGGADWSARQAMDTLFTGGRTIDCTRGAVLDHVAGLVRADPNAENRPTRGGRPHPPGPPPLGDP